MVSFKNNYSYKMGATQAACVVACMVMPHVMGTNDGGHM